ncbi:MAG: hypothetical protein IJY65_00895 [Clostridia bacterium]|nr:hypothetical protein [Clostridia bacterium]
MMMAARYYFAVKQIAEERGYKSISLKDVDGMKKLCGFRLSPYLSSCPRTDTQQFPRTTL